MNLVLPALMLSEACTWVPEKEPYLLSWYDYDPWAELEARFLLTE